MGNAAVGVRGVCVALAVTAGLTLVGCSSSDDAADDTSTTEEPTTETSVEDTTTTRPEVVNTGGEVEIVDFDYLPGSFSVTAGQSVTWKNAGENRHTVTSDGDLFSSSTPIQPGQSFVQAFPDPGTYAYYCTFHPDEMLGTITVE